MDDERRAVKAYFDSVQMTEEYRQRLLALPAEEAPPRLRAAGQVWKALAAAAAVVVIVLAGLQLLPKQRPVSPVEGPGSGESAASGSAPSSGSSEPETGLFSVPPTLPTEPTEPVLSSAEVIETAPMTDPPLPTDRTDPTPPPVPTDPIRPVPEPTQPVTEPDVPVTEPDVPVTEPALPVTEPTQPVTEPIETVPAPDEPVTEATEEETEPTEEDPEPQLPTNGGLIPAEELGWAYEVQRTGDSLFLRITDTATGEVCVLDLTAQLSSPGWDPGYVVFGREWQLCLRLSETEEWLLFVTDPDLEP